MITLGELIALVLPVRDDQGSAPSLLDREVTWATRPRPSPPAFAHLSGGELVLLRQEDLHEVDDRLTLDVAIRQLAGFGVSAVAFAGGITESDFALAQDRDIALLAIPADTDLAAIERQAGQIIADRRRDRQRRGHEAGRRLMELAIAGEPLAAIISTLASVSGQSVALETRDGRMLTFFGQNGNPGREMVEPLLAATSGVVQNWLAVTSDASPAEPPTMHMALGPDLDRTVAPVIGRDGLLGCLSLVGPISAWSGDDGLITSRGAAACAIVLAREFASIAARREIELNVLDEVLDGALRNDSTLLQQASRLGHDLTGMNSVLVCAFQDGEGASGHRQAVDRALGPKGVSCLWRIKEDQIEIVLPPGTPAQRVVDALVSALPEVTIRAGLGREYPGLAGLQRSRTEARQALTIHHRIDMAGPVANYGDLGIYRLLFAAESLPEFEEFHASALGVLLHHDATHHSGFIPTLRAFFAANGSPKDAAERLGVHRNTILYRLGRISALTGHDLDDADTRLRLQLALAIDAIVGPSPNGSPSRA